MGAGRPDATASDNALREPLVPEVLTVLRTEPYGLGRFLSDASAGLTVAIVALPLSMAIAIAAGLPPERGLFAAIVGGFLVSALGGSRHQIGGPAGAFIVVVATVLERHGYEGLVLATILAGGLMIGAGFLRLGTLVKQVPHAVVVGFTAAIGVIIFVSQVRELLGLALPREPAAILPKLAALWAALPTLNARAVALSFITIALLVGIKRLRPQAPALLWAVVIGSAITWLAGLDVATIGSRFGGVPRTLPVPTLPELSVARIIAVAPDALAIALLGGIESLLSAVVADQMSRRTHRSNIELVAQGIANVGAAVFGGMPVTGTIARTATNIRAGGTSPVAGALHAVYLLVFMLVAASLASLVPLAVLAGILAVTSWNMIDRAEIAAMLGNDRAAAAVMISTVLVTVLVELLYGIAAGIALSLLLTAMKRMRSAGT